MTWLQRLDTRRRLILLVTSTQPFLWIIQLKGLGSRNFILEIHYGT